MIVSNKKILFRIIDGGNKLPSSFTNIFEVLDVIRLGRFNLFVFNIFDHTGQKLLNVVDIRGKVFQ